MPLILELDSNNRNQLTIETIAIPECEQTPQKMKLPTKNVCPELWLLYGNNAKMSSGLFKNGICKMCLQIKEDLELNKLQWLICHNQHHVVPPARELALNNLQWLIGNKTQPN